MKCFPKIFSTLIPGPRFVNDAVLGRSILVRRVGNIYYTKPFAEQVFQEIILHHAKASFDWGADM